jgi:hypothetical protein
MSGIHFLREANKEAGVALKRKARTVRHGTVGQSGPTWRTAMGSRQMYLMKKYHWLE